MDEELKILLVEDLLTDAELAEAEIVKIFKAARFKRVDNREDFISALKAFMPDIIVSNYSMAAFNGLLALDITLSLAPEIPFIIYTHPLNENTAVTCMKSGAVDYVIKEDWERLVSAIESVLEIKKIKAEQHVAPQALVERAYCFCQLLGSVENISVYGCNEDGEILYWNKACEKIYGYSVEEAVGNNILDLVVPDERKPEVKENFRNMLNMGKQLPAQEQLLQRKGGQLVSVFSNFVIIDLAGKNPELYCIEIDLTERNRALEEVRLNEQRLHRKEQDLRFLSTATEQSPVSVIITDTSGVIQYVNHKFVNSTKYTREELLGRTLRLFKPGFLPEETLNDLLFQLQNGLAWKGEVRNLKSSGILFWEEVYVSTIKNSQGEITHYLVLSQDITSRKKMELDLVAAKEKAEGNDRLKTAFFNNLSHEIRTPLNAVIGYSQLMNMSGLEMDQMSKYAEFILQASQQLISLMDNIIDMAIIEAGQLKINPVKSSLSKILNVVYNQLKHQADKKGISLQTKALFSRYEADVLIDETKVIQILTNFVENAIKYTDSGYVKFGCSVNEQEIQFFVEDTGAGIPGDLIPLVFERFHQGQNGGKPFQEGLGLGLPISKSYVEAMGGRVNVQSEVNKGSQFSFTIPYNSVIGDLTTKNADTELLFSRHLNIMVVDDVELNAVLVKEFFETLDISVIYASSGQEAIQTVMNKPDIDLVLMDIKMPRMDGYAATQAIKKIRPDLPVVAQTAYALAGDRQKSINAGCDDYLPKPISRNALFAVIRRVVKLNQ